MEITLNEVDVQKLSLQPGDTLVVTVKGEEFLDEKIMGDLRDSFRKKFKNNQVEVVLLAMPEDHDVKLSVIKNEAIPAPYCAGCDCGKKERFEKKEGNET